MPHGDRFPQLCKVAGALMIIGIWSLVLYFAPIDSARLAQARADEEMRSADALMRCRTDEIGLLRMTSNRMAPQPSSPSLCVPAAVSP